MYAIRSYYVQTFDTSLLAKDSSSQKEFMTLFEILASAVDQKNRLETMQAFTQERLGYLKKTIENITDPQNKNLQLYQLQFAYYKLKQRYDDLSIKNVITSYSIHYTKLYETSATSNASVSSIKYLK